MLEDYIAQLHSDNPQQRKTAVLALGKLRDPAALRPLAEIYRTDPDTEIRELALKAGRLIRGDSGSRPADAAPVKIPIPAPEAPPAEAPAKKTTPVTQAAIASAQQATEDALDVSLRGDKGAAVKLLNKALSLHPALIDDTYFRSVASTVLEVDSAEAIELLHDKRERKKVIQETSREHKQKAAQEHFDEVSKFSWGSASLDVVLLTVVNVIGVVIGMAILRQSIEALLALEDDPVGRAMKRQLADYAKMITPEYVTLIAAATVLITLLSIFVQVGIMHLIARYMLHGTGTFRYLLHKILSVYSRYLLISYVLLGIAFVVVIGAAVIPLAYLFGLILGVFSLVTFMKMAGKVSEAYHFSSGMGCVTLLMSVVAITVLNAAVGIAMQNTLVSLLPTLSS